MLRKNQKGQSLVEFALILPILIMLLIGIIEGARIIWAYITVQNAAREAARYAVTGRPFACPSDPVSSSNPDDYCDDVVLGDPWSPQVLTSTRVTAIKNEAMKHGRNLFLKYEAVGDLDEFNDYRNTPGAFGVAVIGQDSANIGGLPNYGGQPGWNVRVETYYNVEIQAPVYNVILSGQVIHLSGQVELQNEGLDPSVEQYVGGITFQSDSCFPNCGGTASTPFISVQDENGDFTEPASSNFTVSVNDHQPNTAYKLWLVWEGQFAQSLDFATDNLGGKLVNFVISASAPPSPDKDYKIYTTLASDTTPVASCLTDLPTNAPCFRVTLGESRIEVRNITQGDEKQQPVLPDQARWPISSSIPIYLYSHTPNENYKMRFNGLDSSSAPGELWFDGSQSTYIPTDALYGTNDDNEPGYYIAKGHTPGDLTIASEDSSFTIVASTTLELIEASMDIAGETISSTHPADDNLYITLRDHAPLQRYEIDFEDGITPPAVVRATENGSLSFNYVIPFGVQEPGTAPVPVEIYTLDHGRGERNPDNKIASRIIQVFTPIDPYINVPGGARWPAGSPIVIQLRRHKPNTEYGVYFQRSGFSEQVNGINYTTDTHPGDGLGYKNINYTIPASYEGFYVIRSFETPDLDNPVASFAIEVTSNPYITIDNGHRWPPGSKITIRLKNHASVPHEVWLDKGGTFETFLGLVSVDSSGEGVVQFTIPEDFETRIDPDYYSIRSYLNGVIVAETELEVSPADLIVSKIDVPNVIFDVEVPITLTISNLQPVTVANTYFDTDIYIVPPSRAPGNILYDGGLPPGDHKNWLDYVPPNGSVTVEDAIVVYGQQEHEIWGRVDTGDYVAEGGPPGEGNNTRKKIISGACPSEINDEFPGDGLAEWTQTDFGDSGATCPTPADLPPPNTGGGGTVLLDKNWDGLFWDWVADPADGTVYEGFTFVQDPLGTSGSTYNYMGRDGGDPASAFFVGPRKAKSSESSSGAWIEFTNTLTNVTISFKYLLRVAKMEASQNEWAEYYFIIDPDPAVSGDEISYDGGTGNGYLVRGDGGWNDIKYYPTGYGFNQHPWPEATVNLTLPAGTHRIFVGVKSSARNMDDEYAIAYLDSLVITEQSGPPAPPNPAGTIWSAHYDSGLDSFTPFAKDMFYGLTSSGNQDPIGSPPLSSEGAWANGSLYTKLGRWSGGSGNNLNMTGGWSRQFTVPAGSSCVAVQGYYRLKFSSEYESDERGEVLLAVDDNTAPRVVKVVSGNGNGGNDYDSGWVAFNESFELTPGTHTLYLGGHNNQATYEDETTEIWFDDVYVVDTGAGVGASSGQSESGGALLMTNRGSSAILGDDNGSSAGYHFMHLVAGGLTEMYVRVDQAPPNGSSGLAGLEIRSDYEDGQSAKIMFGYASDNKLKIYRRGSGASQADHLATQSNVNAPVWLKILRNGDEFKFYYVVSSSDIAPSDWTLMHTEQNVTDIPQTIRVGLFNAPFSGSTTYQAKFKHFHICAETGGSGGSGGSGPIYLGNKCGQVEENGDGLVVIDAVNTIINNPSTTHSWQTVVVDNVLGEASMEALQATPDNGTTLSGTSGPHATYQVNIESAGSYYVWVAGWGPNTNGDAVIVGRQGSQVGNIDGFPTGAAAPGWVKMSGSVNLAAAIHTIDLWMAEDGVRVFKLLLTKEAGFVPPPEGLSQSACTIISGPHVPPLMNQCTNVIRLGGFEGTAAELQSAWPSSGGANVGASLSKYTGTYGANLALLGGMEMPLIYQTFDLQVPSPPGILADTTAILKLYNKVEVVGSAPDEQLRFALRRDSDGFILVDIPVADGTSTQNWTLFSQNVFAGLNPLSLGLEPGDKLRAYFYTPAPGFVTVFHLDDISLNFCSTQPAPDPVAGTGKVSGKTRDGAGAPLAGANVWAYAYADEQTGGAPGPVFRTYSLSDGTYRFYNLPAGSYMIYTEIQMADGLKFDQRYVSVPAGGEVTNIILTIVAAKSG